MSANLENSAVATGLEKISFHSNPKEGQCQKNVQTTIQLLSFHMLTRLCSKSFRLGFSSTWTVNFQKQGGFHKGRETRDQSANIFWRKQGSSRKMSTSASLTMLKPLTVWITTNYGKFLEMGVTHHPTCLPRNLYAGQEATCSRYGTMDWFQIGKGCILSPCLFNFYAEYIMWNVRLDETQAGIKISGRNIDLRYANDTTPMAESEEQLKHLLMRVRRRVEKLA